jgi:2-amino-4-hydroxy-6-hydroxymethyldihydropteridine diphosphokinase
MDMATVFLSLGSNVGNRRFYIEKMIGKLASVMEPGLRQSLLMETEPVGMPAEEPWFLNCIVCAGFGGSARSLLAECKRIERELGRTGKMSMKARTADIDILLYGHAMIREPSLVVPHPRILDRRFCLEGLRLVGPYWKLPGSKLTITEQWRHMPQRVSRQKIIFMSGKNPSSGQGQSR